MTHDVYCLSTNYHYFRPLNKAYFDREASVLVDYTVKTSSPNLKIDKSRLGLLETNNYIFSNIGLKYTRL